MRFSLTTLTSLSTGVCVALFVTQVTSHARFLDLWLFSQVIVNELYSTCMGINTFGIFCIATFWQTKNEKLQYRPYIFLFYFSVPYDLRKTPPFYTAVHSTVSKVLNSNGYSEVNLSKLFSAFFVWRLENRCQWLLANQSEAVSHMIQSKVIQLNSVIG